jgi:hypothetical protein
MLRKSGYGDLEVVAVVLADMTDKVDSVNKAIFGGFPFILARWRVSS